MNTAAQIEEALNKLRPLASQAALVVLISLGDTTHVTDATDQIMKWADYYFGGNEHNQEFKDKVTQLLQSNFIPKEEP